MIKRAIKILLFLLSIWVVVFVLLIQTRAQSGTTGGGNPPNEIRRAGSRLVMGTDGNAYFDLASGKVIRIKNTCTGAAVSTTGEVSVCYDNSTTPKSIKASFNGAAYVVIGNATGVTTDAPANATYITQTANATLTNEQALSALSTGILKNTTTTGVLSIALAGTDYESPLTFSAPLSRTVNAVSCPTCGLTTGTLAQFSVTTSAELRGVLSDELGTGAALFDGATPTAFTLTNATGLPITAGTTGTLGIARGGTGLTTATDDSVAVYNGTIAELKTVPNCTDASGNHLNYTAATNTFSCGTSAATEISGLTTGQYIKAASATTIQTDGVKRYVALVSQAGTNAPTATVLENTLGGIVTFARLDVGLYTCTLTGAFGASDNTFYSPQKSIMLGPLQRLSVIWNDEAPENGCVIRTEDSDVSMDSVLDKTPIEIRIYPL